MNGNMANQNPATQRESLTELLKQLANNSAAVIHDEIELVVQRIREKERTVRSGVLMMAAGAVATFAAFLYFCTALFIQLTEYMPPVFAALAAGGTIASAGIIVAFIGYRQLKKSIF